MDVGLILACGVVVVDAVPDLSHDLSSLLRLLLELSLSLSCGLTFQKKQLKHFNFVSVMRFCVWKLQLKRGNSRFFVLFEFGANLAPGSDMEGSKGSSACFA